MYLSLKVFITFLLIIVFVKPNFVFYSYLIARISDFLGVVILFVLLFALSMRERNLTIKRKFTKYLVLNILFVVNILISIFYSVYLGREVVFQDFTDVIRPFIIAISLFLGAVLVHFRYTKENYLDFLILLGIISGIVAFLEYFGMSFFYKLYSDENHMRYNRVSSIYYDFAEFGILQNLSLVAIWIKFSLVGENKRKIKKIIYVAFYLLILISIILSTSKAAIVLTLLTIILLFSDYILSNALIRGKIKIFLLNKVAISLFVFFLGIFFFGYYFSLNENLSMDLYKTIIMDDSNPSVNNRNIQRSYVLDQFYLNDMQTLIGHSAYRSSNSSYIEITLFSILFRYGVIGVFLYYSCFLLFIFEKISRPFHLFKYIILSAIFLDCFASMTSRFSFPIAMFILVGLLGSVSNSKKY